MRVVLDANVLAPGFLGTTSASAQLIELWRQDVYELVMSEHLLGELLRTYTDPYFAVRSALRTPPVSSHSFAAGHSLPNSR